MKKFFTLALLAATCCQLSAQVMNVHCGQITTRIPVSATPEFTINKSTPDAYSLLIADAVYPFAAIDSITFSKEAWQANSIGVDYAGAAARINVGYDVAPLLAITVDGADVSIIQDAALQQEVLYTLSGSSDNGSFFMDGEFKASVTLDDLRLTSRKSAAIDIANGKRINILLPDGTNTVLSDAAGGLQKACFFVNGHAEFSGKGTLTLTGNTKHAYASDEYTELKTDAGKITVLAAKSDAMHIEQYFLMNGGEIEVVSADGDGIDVSITKNPLDELNGQTMINAGKLSINVTGDDTKGIKSDSLLSILGGTVSVTVPSNGSKGISAGTDMIVGTETGGPSITVNATGTTYMPGNATLESKCMGIRTRGNLTVKGGTVTVTSTGANARVIKVDGIYKKTGGTVNGKVDW